MFFWEIADYHWIRKDKTIFMYGIWKNIQLNIGITSQIVQKFRGELNSQAKLIFQEPWDYGSPLAFSVNETLSFQENCQDQCCVCDLGN